MTASRPPVGRRLAITSVVGARGFEPPTSRSRTVRATRLRYAPLRPAYCTGLRLPRILADELDEHAVPVRRHPHRAAHILHQRQRLVQAVADRHDHPAALGQLL